MTLLGFWAAKRILDVEGDHTPWLVALGYVFSGLAAGQVMLYRSVRLGFETAGRFPVTPLLAQAVRGFGEAFAVVFALMGVCSGLQAVLVAEKGLQLPIGGFDQLHEMGGMAIIGGPVAAYLLLLVVHFVTETAVALVAIANHTSPKP